MELNGENKLKMLFDEYLTHDMDLSDDYIEKFENGKYVNRITGYWWKSFLYGYKKAREFKKFDNKPIKEQVGIKHMFFECYWSQDLENYNACFQKRQSLVYEDEAVEYGCLCFWFGIQCYEDRSPWKNISKGLPQAYELHRL